MSRIAFLVAAEGIEREHEIKKGEMEGKKEENKVMCKKYYIDR